MLGDTEEQKAMCFCPNTVQILTHLESGEIRSIFHVGTYKNDYNDGVYKSECFSVPCGECVECLEQYSNVWAYRCVLEARQHKENCMITLTYDNKHNPVTLVRRDVQLFLKRLRRAHKGISIRYFGCGEYGGQSLRPHFHILLFGWKPSDLLYFKKQCDHVLYISQELEDLWGQGFCSVCDCNMYTAKYSAKYLQKMRPVPSYLKPAFTFMSLKPGIGFGGVTAKNYETDKLYLDGHSVSLPRYFVSKGSDEQREFIHRCRVLKADLIQHNVGSRVSRSIYKLKVFGKLKK